MTFEEWFAKTTPTMATAYDRLIALAGWNAAIEAAAKVLDMSPSELRLMGGEFSQQEMRAVKAVLSALEHRIRALRSGEAG